MFKSNSQKTQEFNRDTMTVSKASYQKERGSGLWYKANWDDRWYQVLDIDKPNREGWHQAKLFNGFDDFLISVEGKDRLFYSPEIKELQKEIVTTLTQVRSSHQNGTIIFNRFDTIAQADAYTRALWLAGWIQQNETF